jgi:hypothetical protein
VQFGLKLRAADACNLIYVMWRVQPESKLVVSVKSNPGAHRSAECGNHGYQNIKPQSSAPVPAVAPGQMHTLRAIVTGSELQAWVDGRPVWRAQLGAVAGAMSGPAGVRSDDARLEFELAVDQAPAAAGALPGCRVGSEESE